MMRSFLAVVSVAALAATAAAQAPAPVPQSCAGGVCPRIQAAVTQVRVAGACVLRAAGNVVAGPVRGVYGDGTACSCPAVHSVPQRMPVCERQHQPLHRLHLLLQKVTGR